MAYETLIESVRPATAWYSLYTRHQHEKRIAESLAAKGFEIFLPLYEQIRSWSDRQKRLRLPLFPGYVFVRASLDRRMDIVATPGIHGFVSFANVPTPIPQAEIEDLQRIVRLAKVEPHPFLRYGDWVRVTTGPLEGIEGFLVRRKGPSRLVLAVEILHKSAAVEIDALLTERILRSTRKEISSGCALRVATA